VFLKKKINKNNFEKKKQKNERKNNFGRKKAKKNGKKKHAVKVKAEFSTSSILKKKLDKNNFETKHVGKHCSKICGETL
jgi:C4-type Zn-finger protein